MENVIAAIKMLKNEGYKAFSVAGHTVVVMDLVQCSSGSRKWTEEREHPINVARGLQGVAFFISERE